MKKILSATLIVMLLCVSLSFVGCNTKNGGSTTVKKTAAAPTPTPVPTPYENKALINYMKENADKIYKNQAYCIDTYTGSYIIDGDNVTVTLKTSFWNGTDPTIVDMAISLSSDAEAHYNGSHNAIKKAVSNLGKFKVRVCDLSGTLLYELPHKTW